MTFARTWSGTWPPSAASSRPCPGAIKALTVLVERKKAQIGALVKHPFHVIKNLFGYKKVSYRGLRKNGVRLYAQFALANLVLAKRAAGRRAPGH